MSEVHDIIPSFNFYLLVNGVDEIPLKSVQPFSRDNEYEPIQEGGMNDYVYLKRKPISQPFKLVVERYVDYGLGLGNPLTNGTELLLPLILYVGKNVGGAFDSGRYYTFTGAVIMGIQYGGLDAEKGGLHTETITFGYNHMFVLTTPGSESSSAPAWSMFRNRLEQLYSKRGNTPAQNDERWDDIEYGPTGDDTIRDKAHRWNFDEKKVKGQGTASHVTFKRSKEEDKAEQRKYNFAAENNKEYKGDKKSVRSAQNAAYSDKTLGPKLGIQELSKENMGKKANKFEMAEGSFTGNGWISAKHNPVGREKRAKDMIDAANVWEFDKDQKNGKGTRSAQNYLVTEHRELEGGGSAGLGMPEDSKETMKSRAVRGAKNTNAGVVGTDPVPRKWEFDEGGTKEGKGDRSRQNAAAVSEQETSGIGVTESSKEDMASVSHKWAFVENDKYATKGNEVQSARKVEGLNEETKTDLAELSKKWEFDEGGTKEGKGERSRQNAQKSENGDSSGMGVTELSKEKMSGASRKWEFTDQHVKAGGGISSRVPPKVEENSKTDAAKAAVHGAKNTNNKTEGNKGIEPRRWEFDDKEPATKEGQGTASRVPPRVPETAKGKIAEMAVHGAKNSNNKTAGNKGIEPRKWEMDAKEPATKDGQGTASRVPPRVKETSKTDAEKMAVHGAENTNNKTEGNTGIEPRSWNFDEKEPATKAGQGTPSRVAPPVAEASKADMQKKAVRHVKQTITDFLMG